MFVYQRAALQGPADKTPSDNTPSDLGREARLRHALAAFDTLRSSSEERGGSLLMQGALASSEPTIHQCPGTGRRILCWLGLTRPNELAHRLSVSASTPGPRLVLAAFEKWGEACPRYLRGEYSFVITGANGDMLLAARDAIGTRPLYYRDGAEGFLISAMAAVFPALIRSLEPDPWWLSCKLLRRSGDPRRTAWTDVFKVPPGHALTLRDGRAHVWRWHRFGENGSEHDAVQDEPPRTAADWVVRYGDALETAVTTRVDLAESLGCEASGGIDSSAVLAMAVPYARQRGIPVQGFASLLQDGEEHRVLVCSAHLRMEQTHVFVPQGQIYAPSEQLLHEIRVCGYPLEHRWPVGARSFLALARRLDVDTLLSGFGGDEIVSNHARKVPRELWSQRDWRHLLGLMRGATLSERIGMMRVLMRDVTARQGEGMRDERERRLAASVLKADVREDPLIREQVLPSEHLFPPEPGVNAAALARLKGGLVPTRLEGSALMGLAHGIEYRFPLLDTDLIDTWLSTPSWEKWHARGTRWLHRRALAERVPEAVAFDWEKTSGPRLRRARDHWRRIEAIVPLVEQLRSGLHPALADLIDEHRLEEIFRRIERREGSVVDIRDMRRNLRELRMLDLWLRWLDECRGDFP